ncbi:DNA polymerase I [Coxiella endosymbiont of Amblyomma americanum]|nr:DNA polymerase I [Coxiella endosymbiont of Amblyomma americanum]
MLKKLVVHYKSEYVAVIFDPKGKTFRHNLYNDYKINRQKMPSELSQQIEPLFEIIKALGFPLIVKDGYEADDVIATLAKKAEAEGFTVLVSTGDKDLAQIVNNHITLVNTMTGCLLNPARVVEKFGVPPEKIVDYLCLAGDNVDNIPHIPKIGPKTAIKWLNEYGSLENIQNQAKTIKGKVGESLRAHLHKLPLIRKLVTVISDVSLETTPIELKLQPKKNKKLIELFTKYEFRSWLSETITEVTTKFSTTSNTISTTNYINIFEEKIFKTWKIKLRDAKEFALNIKTTTKSNIKTSSIIGIAFAIQPNEAAYIPIGHDYIDVPTQLEKGWVLQQLRPIIGDSKKKIIGQNLKYISHILMEKGVTVKAKMYDIQLESYILNNSNNQYDLNTLALHYLGYSTKTIDVSLKNTSNTIFSDKVAYNATKDVDLTLQLHHVLVPLIKKEKHLKKIFFSIETPLLPILMHMEVHGVLIDTQVLYTQNDKLRQGIDQLKHKSYKTLGKTCNINSLKQLRNILYNELRLPILKKTSKGQPSTENNILKKLALYHSFPKIILEYRKLNKLTSTYIDHLLKQINPLTGRIHTSYNQTVTLTGRLSSSNPNLQNIPIHTKEGRKIRNAFIAPQGSCIVAADYSQMELRIIAHMSKDPNLIIAFKKELDIHNMTASEIFGVSLTQVTAEQRHLAKSINFGLLYGMSSLGLKRQLDIKHGFAKKYINTYFKHYSTVYEYRQEIRNIAFSQGYVKTLFGRRIYFPNINTANPQHRRATERIAINATIQGTASDIIKIAMIKINDWLKNHNIVNSYLTMQVHDELVFEVSKKDLVYIVPKIKQIMEAIVSLAVPLVVNIKVGNNWGETH